METLTLGKIKKIKQNVKSARKIKGGKTSNGNV